VYVAASVVLPLDGTSLIGPDRTLAEFVNISDTGRHSSSQEHEQLETLVRKGKSAAQRLLKARILLKADVSESGEGWSDNRIIKALDTSVSMVYRVRKQLAGEPTECFNPTAVVMRAEALSRKQGHVGAVAFSRTGDPATGDFSDAKVIRKFGDVPDDLNAL
jgi:hypothetical protein